MGMAILKRVRETGDGRPAHRVVAGVVAVMVVAVVGGVLDFMGGPATPRPVVADALPSVVSATPAEPPADGPPSLEATVEGSATAATPAGLEGWQWHHTEHFRVGYRGGFADARRRGRLLERTHDQFVDVFTRAGFELKPIREPLACLVFPDRGEMIRYAREADGADVTWTAAYYSARTNRVALVQLAANPEPPGLIEPLDPQPAPDSNPEVQAQPAATTTSPLDRVAVASTTHEAAHQLAFNAGLQRRGVLYPLWVSEGLATNFELEEGHTLGPAADNPLRRRHLALAHDADALLPLAEMVTLTRVPTDDPEAVRRVYAQSWALFRFLFETHPVGLASYLQALRNGSNPRPTPAQLRRLFELHIAPLDEVDPEWHAWVTQTVSP